MVTPLLFYSSYYSIICSIHCYPEHSGAFACILIGKKSHFRIVFFLKTMQFDLLNVIYSYLFPFCLSLPLVFHLKRARTTIYFFSSTLKSKYLTKCSQFYLNLREQSNISCLCKPVDKSNFIYLFHFQIQKMYIYNPIACLAVF